MSPIWLKKSSSLTGVLSALVLLPLLGAVFYDARSMLDQSSWLFLSAPSFIFSLWMFAAGSCLLRQNVVYAVLLLLLCLLFEFLQILPVWQSSVRFDFADVIFTLFGAACGFAVYWSSALCWPKQEGNTSGEVRVVTTKLKERNAWILLALFGAAASIGSYGVYDNVAEPVTMPREQLQNEIRVSDPMVNPEISRLYAKGNFLYGVVEGQGIQVIDNTDPMAPVNVAFIHLMGVHDIVMKDDTFFANQYSDLVIYSIKDQKELSRMNELYLLDEYIKLPRNTIWNPDFEIPAGHVAIGYKIIGKRG